MADQHEDHTGRRRNVPIKHVLQGGVDGLGRKTQGRQDVGPPANLFHRQVDRDNALPRQHPHKHGFESSASAEEYRREQTGCLANNLREVAVAATADKEHIQQMTMQNDDLLKVVRNSRHKSTNNRRRLIN